MVDIKLWQGSGIRDQSRAQHFTHRSDSLIGSGRFDRPVAIVLVQREGPDTPLDTGLAPSEPWDVARCAAADGHGK